MFVSGVVPLAVPFAEYQSTLIDVVLSIAQKDVGGNPGNAAGAQRPGCESPAEVTCRAPTPPTWQFGQIVAQFHEGAAAEARAAKEVAGASGRGAQ